MVLLRPVNFLPSTPSTALSSPQSETGNPPLSAHHKMHSTSTPSLSDKKQNRAEGNDRNLFRHIPLNSRLLENMNMALFQEIKTRQEDFMRAFNAGDPSGAAEVYDKDGYFMPNGHSPVKGRGGIESYFRQDMADGVASAQIITEEVNGSGDWAFERGSYHLDGSRGTESGAYLQVWKKIDGTWFIHNDCFNVIKAAQ